MNSEWKEFALSDVAKVITGKTPPGTLDKYFGGETLFVTPTDMTDRKYVDTTQRTLSAEGVRIQHRYIFERGIAVSCIGWQMGKSAIVRVPASANQQINVVLPKEDVIDLDYLYYILKSKSKAIFELGATATRTPIVKKSLFEKITFIAPSLAKQREISDTLSALDEKIEVNRTIIRTLEAMAQAIFKSWFVDFDPVKAKMAARESGTDPTRAAMAIISGKNDTELDAFQQQDPKSYEQLRDTAEAFPDALVESELGMIPEGWGVSTIGDEVTVVGGGTPSTKNLEFWDGGTINWTTPKDLSNRQEKVLLDTERCITSEGLAKISSGLLPVDTVLMSSRAPVGYLALAKVPVAVNQGYIAMKCEQLLPPEYVLLWAESIMDDIKGRASGTTFAEISKQNFRAIPMVVPSEIILAGYSEAVGAYYRKVTDNVRENTVLTELRGSLLPKLLSGDTSLAQEA